MAEYCNDCHAPCKVVEVEKGFHYSGTHCTGGKDGFHSVKEPGSSCCGEDTESGKWWLCKCGYEAECHPDMEAHEIICPACKRIGCFTDDY